MDRIAVKSNVKRDSDGFEDIDDFWESTEPVIPAPSTTTTTSRGALSKVEANEYDTSDEISDEEEEASTRFSYDTNRTINMSMNTTVMEEDYDTDENVEGDGVQSRSKSSSNASSRRNSAASTGSGGGGASPLSVLKSGSSSASGGRRVSFGSPILHDQANTPYSAMSSGSNSLADSGRRSSAGSSSSRRSSTDSSGSDLESSMMTNVTTISTPGSADFPRGRVLADETFVQHGGDDDAGSASESEDEATMNDSGFTTDDSLVRSAMKRPYREDSSEDEHSDDSEEERNGPCRRSKRQTKGQKFQFWKNERAVYDRGSMIGFLQAEPTPKKPKRGGARGRPAGGNGTGKHLKFSKEEEGEPEQPVALPRGVNYLDRSAVEELNVWDETKDDVVDAPVVCLNERVNPMQLPPAANRPNNKKHLVGMAAQSFNVKESPSFMSAWISGFVELPPHGIKDPECVGDCAQVFFVSECQDEALEFALADPKDEDWNEKLAQRLLLKNRDSFYVPPGNVYRLENHSSTKSCVIYWTIIKALSSYHQNKSGDNNVAEGVNTSNAAPATVAVR